MTTTGLEQRIAAPIPGGRLGEDPKYDDRYIALKDEIAKLDSPSAKGVDWDSVERLATDIVTSVAKDLFATTYLAYAQHRKHGLPGLASGLLIVDSFLSTYGADCFPTRARARANAITWLVDAVSRDLEGRALAPHEAEAAVAVREASVALAARVRGSFGDDAPSFATFDQALARIAATAGDAQPPLAPPVYTAPLLVEAIAPIAELAQPAPLMPSPITEAPSLATVEPTPVVARAPAIVREIAAGFLTPISDAAPTGPEAKYDTDYEAIAQEMAKLNGVSGAPDFVRVAQLGERLLKEKTKDLLVASYLAVALVERDGLAGLPLALSVPAALLERFEAELHPVGPRLRRRANALSLLYERLAQRLPELPLLHTDREIADDVLLLGKEHARIVSNAFESDGPATRTLLEALARLAISVPEPPREEPPPVVAPQGVQSVPETKPAIVEPPRAEAQAPTQTASAPVSVAMPDVPVADVAELGPFLGKVGHSLVEAAIALRAIDVADPRAMRLLRTGLYLHIESAPPHGPDGKTSMPAPPDQLFDRLAKMSEHEKWAAILEETEASLGQFRFSLDLHRHSAAALRGLGRTDARAQLVATTRAFVERVPGISSLKFANGRAFADADTLRFIKSELSGARGGGDAQSADAAASPEVTAALAALEQAKEEAKLDDMLARADELVALGRDERERFGARVRVANALADAGHERAAHAMHEALETDVAAHALERWDAKLVLTHLTAYAAVLKSLGGREESRDRVLSRIARLSPRAYAESTR